MRGDGHWICGFSKNLGHASAYVAELWGAWEGLKIAKDKGFRLVELQMDSSVVVNCLNGEKNGSFSGWSLVHQIKLLMQSDWRVRVKHVYREANRCADVLANLGCDQEGQMHLYEHPPSKISQLLLADVVGVATPRVVNLKSFLFWAFAPFIIKKEDKYGQIAH